MTPKYNLSQPATCQTLRLMWDACIANNGPIVAFKPLYTITYCEEQKVKVNEAAALPDEAARTLIHAQLHDELVVAGKGCTSKWQAAKIYINGAFKTKEERETQYRGAGWEHYETAANEHWPSVESLMNAGITYINNHLDILKGEDDDNMPASFPDEFTAAFTLFSEKWTAFGAAEQQATVGGDEKVAQINDCYDTAILMGEVGQYVFAENEAIKKQFVFETVGALVDHGSPASLEVTVMVDGAPKAGAEVHIVNTDKYGVTNEEGKALLTQVSHGNIECEVVCDGFNEKTVAATITAGTRKRITVTLEPLFTGDLTVGSETPASQPESSTPTNS